MGRRLRLRPGPAGPEALVHFRWECVSYRGDAGPAAVRVFLWSEAVGEACHGVIVPISARISPGALSPGARCDGPTSTSACWPTVLPSGIVALRGSSGRARTLTLGSDTT